MNYNPYYFASYANSVPIKNNLFGGLLHNQRLNFSSFLNGTQKVLNIANQAIPVIKQISPVMKNAKTMFKVMNEFKKVETPIITEENNVNKMQSTENLNTIEQKEPTYTDGPTFFL